MNIENLHIDKCPSWKIEEAHAREALATLGRADIPVITRLLTNAEEAARTAFADSPTMAFDGVGVFPFGGKPTVLLAVSIPRQTGSKARSLLNRSLTHLALESDTRTRRRPV